MADLTKYITFATAAERAGVDLSTIHRAVQRAELVPDMTADGKVKLLRAEDVERWRDAAGSRRPGPKTGVKRARG